MMYSSPTRSWSRPALHLHCAEHGCVEVDGRRRVGATQIRCQTLAHAENATGRRRSRDWTNVASPSILAARVAGGEGVSVTVGRAGHEPGVEAGIVHGQRSLPGED